mmetsp:Transcript_22113/g.44741  ORF Transcript_22113/g.44741 Transcript_22113/m.44741 type:complete len:100 (-) Transcript_22113:39-338(-)
MRVVVISDSRGEEDLEEPQGGAQSNPRKKVRLMGRVVGDSGSVLSSISLHSYCALPWVSGYLQNGRTSLGSALSSAETKVAVNNSIWAGAVLKHGVAAT